MDTLGHEDSGAGAGPVTADALLDGRLRLFQRRAGHRAGTDSLLLAAFARALPGRTVVELGAGVGAAGLCLAQAEPSRRVWLVEIDGETVALARRNVAENDLGARVAAVHADVLDVEGLRAALAAAGGPSEAEMVVMNPPWLDAASRPSPDGLRRQAHHMPEGGLAAWVEAAARLLKRGGRLVMVHRADALGGVLGALRPSFGAIAVRPVQPAAGKPAGRLLLAARKGGRTPLALLPPFVLHEAGGGFTPEAEAVHRVLAAIPAA